MSQQTRCPVCDEKDFENIDGMYYCLTCCSQIPKVFDTEVESYGQENYMFSSKLKRALPDVDKYGCKWSTIEGFQFVIKEQVKALIALGADPKLKDVVFDLWVKYLTKINIAFNNSAHGEQPFIIKFPTRSRDVAKTKGGSSVVKLMSQSQETPESSGRFSSYRFTRSTYINIARMSMAKTIAFCYLGLLYTNNLTMPSDIVRWIQNGKLPYLYVSSQFPEDFKFFAEDTVTFNPPNIPSTKRIRLLCGQLIYFLKLSDIPRIPVLKLVHKCICQLNLPGHIHGLAVNIISERTQFFQINHKSLQSLPPMELFAMAYVIILIKTLFRLDGINERKMSSFAAEYAKLIEDDDIFIWENWANHMTAIANNLKLQRETHKPCATTVIQDLEQFLDHCKETSCYKTRISVNTKKKTSLHESINSLFINIADYWKESIPELDSSISKDLPLSSDSFSVPVNHKSKFRQCSITYRTQPKDFLHQNRYKLSDSTIQSATEYESSDADTEILSSQMDLFTTGPVQKKPRLLACKVVANTLKQGRRRSIDTNECKYLQMKLESLNINNTYLPADNITFTDYTDRTYQWLVSVCSYLIEENKHALNNQVCNLEYLLKLQPYSKSRKGSFLNIYQYFKK
ncbi:TATA box-binding protein-associated factor RNA polymerase I subunit B [Octopus bimaculoides]|uniref:TATA box-binding protein-associated factor RNA polymerase I subunit B n=1 Tax=Octopus bimaculoides TaxID=37653 RepID=A0A0L8IEW0_OCTBM|nr:TATA box-binding protein-associated factor RNA polymerase I subunit B [Octopus bimaculoides]|eukprot:XP_014774628.1 PREDICTED: TATA box-binding protein-associated factor RNA polymerase I subunit B-like [Octopus bimaculoides]